MNASRIMVEVKKLRRSFTEQMVMIENLEAELNMMIAQGDIFAEISDQDMITKILESTTNEKTLRFIKGLQSFLDRGLELSEKQRECLQSTFEGFV